MTERTALGVYIFAGGFTTGVKRAGFKVLGHLEDGPFGVATSEANHPELRGNVRIVPELWNAEDFRGVDFVYGNPPCAPWSQAGMSPLHKRGIADKWYERDPRVSCVYQMFDVLEKVRPRVWAWESVARAATVGRDLIDTLAARAAALGYSTSLVLLNGADAGVPQDRKRVFVVFHDVAIDWTRPNVTRKSVREALASVPKPAPEDLPKFPESYKTLLPQVPRGTKLWVAHEKVHGPQGYGEGKRVKGRPAFLYARLDWDQLAYTTTGHPKHFHPDEDRLLSVAEQAAICGYAPDYTFLGNHIRVKFEQLSKAVLPAAGEWLARNVLAGIEAAVPTGAPMTRVVDFIEGSEPPGTLTTHGIKLVEMTTRKEKAVTDVVAKLRYKCPDCGEMTEPGDEIVNRTPGKRPGVWGHKRCCPPSELPAPRPVFEPALPAQVSTLPLWETFTGPTAIAKVLIAEGHDDGPILATTAGAIRGAQAAGAKWPHLFTRTDLQRLRARLERDKVVVMVEDLNNLTAE